MINNILQRIVDDELDNFDPESSDMIENFDNMLQDHLCDDDINNEDYIENKVYIKDIREAIKNSKSMPKLLEKFRKIIIKECGSALLSYVQETQINIEDNKERLEYEKKQKALETSAIKKLKAINLSREEKDAIGLRV